MPLSLLTENRGKFIIYRFRENNLPFSTVNPVTETGLTPKFTNAPIILQAARKNVSG